MTSDAWEFPLDYFEKEESERPARRPKRFKAEKAAGATEGQPAEQRVLSPEKLEQRAKNILLHQLSRQAKSEFQLRKVLAEREIPDDIINSVVTRFTEAGLIDDMQFATIIANTRRSTRGLSTSAIRRELKTKGVADSIVEKVLEPFSIEDDLATATALAIKKLRSMANLADDVRKRRLFGFLARKGYPSSVVFSAARAAETELHLK